MSRDYSHKWRVTYKFNGYEYEEGFIHEISAIKYSEILIEENIVDNILEGKKTVPYTDVIVYKYPKNRD